jgi:hypothetical protein
MSIANRITVAQANARPLYEREQLTGELPAGGCRLVRFDTASSTMHWCSRHISNKYKAMLHIREEAMFPTFKSGIFR